jgi:hypothetical protein
MMVAWSHKPKIEGCHEALLFLVTSLHYLYTHWMNLKEWTYFDLGKKRDDTRSIFPDID